MEPRVYYNLLHKILYCLKYRNSESYEEYKDIVFSPLYVELFESVKKELDIIDSGKLNMTKEKKYLRDYPEEFERVCSILRNTSFASSLSTDIKKELINIIIYPFKIDSQEENRLVSLVN